MGAARLQDGGMVIKVQGCIVCGGDEGTFPYGVPALSGKVVSENGDMLVTSERLCYPNLFHCESNGKLLEKYQWQGEVPRVLGLCFKESLIRHAFFQRKNGRRGRVPRFFPRTVGALVLLHGLHAYLREYLEIISILEA